MGSIIILPVGFQGYVSLSSCSLIRKAVNNQVQNYADIQNEDCGQMSAWYLFSAMGFYPGMSLSSSAQQADK
jgi:putative alpha-1,2-mannosidase